MSRWLRILSILIGARFRKKIKPDEEITLNFRVRIADVDLSIMNNTAIMAITELGRWDYAVRTGFLKYAWITFRKGKERIPFEKVISDFNWEMTPKTRPEMIDDFVKGETLFLENCETVFHKGKQ